MGKGFMRFLIVIFWEFLQNLPIFAGFVLAFDFWQKGNAWLALASILVGSILGSIMIALTESRKVAGHREPLSVLLTNIVVMATIMFALLAYLSAGWSGWLTDLLIGGLGGVTLGMAQSLAAKKKIGIRHCIALGLAAALVIIAVRVLLNVGWPIWVNVLSITILATLVISFIDYSPERKKSG